MPNASGRMPLSTCFHVTGAAIGNPGRARGEYVPMARGTPTVAQIINEPSVGARGERG
jgi:hypothetical protein